MENGLGFFFEFLIDLGELRFVFGVGFATRRVEKFDFLVLLNEALIFFLIVEALKFPFDGIKHHYLYFINVTKSN